MKPSGKKRETKEQKQISEKKDLEKSNENRNRSGQEGKIRKRIEKNKNRCVGEGKKNCRKMELLHLFELEREELSKAQLHGRLRGKMFRNNGPIIQRRPCHIEQPGHLGCGILEGAPPNSNSRHCPTRDAWYDTACTARSHHRGRSIRPHHLSLSSVASAGSRRGFNLLGTRPRQPILAALAAEV